MPRGFTGLLRDFAFGLLADGEEILPSEIKEESREELAANVYLAQQEWVNAQNYFNYATEPELVDHAILSVQAAERKYMYWLQQIKKLE